MASARKLAVVTGASSGIGFELARCAADDGCDLIVVADEAQIYSAAESFRQQGVDVEAIQADLATDHGLDRLWATIEHREVDYLIANAGRGLGEAFLVQDWNEIEAVIRTNVTGTTSLLHRVVRKMRTRNAGRILIVGSIAGLMPGSFQAVYNATKAYLDTLSWGIRNELSDTEVTVTCLMPGPTDTEFFERAHMEDTPVGRKEKDDPAMVARTGYRAMLKGTSGITSGFMNKVQAALSGIIPDSVLARMHREMAEPKEQENS